MPATGVDPHVTRPTTLPVVGAGVGAGVRVAVIAGVVVVVRLAAGVADCGVRATLGVVAMGVLERGGAVRVGPGVTANVLLGAAVAGSSGVGDDAPPPDEDCGAAHAASMTAATPSARPNNIPQKRSTDLGAERVGVDDP